MVQDRRGYVWFATQSGGVCRFDGKHFENYGTAEGLPSIEVLFLHQDPQGAIWASTTQGLATFNGRTFEKVTEFPSSDLVYSMCTVDQTMYFATAGSGIWLLKNNAYRQIGRKEGMPYLTAYSLTTDKQGNVYAGLDSGMVRIHKDKVQAWTGDQLPIKYPVCFSAYTDKQGTIWFGTTSGQLLHLSSNGTWQSISLPKGKVDLSKDFIGGISGDKNNCLWIAASHGLVHYCNNTFTLYSESNGLSLNETQCVMVDYLNHVWVGTRFGGANLLESLAVEVYQKVNGLPGQNCTSLCKLNVNEYAVGTNAGLAILSHNAQTNEQIIIAAKVPNFLEKAFISAIASDHKGRLWLADEHDVYVGTLRNNQWSLIKKLSTTEGESLPSVQKIIPLPDGSAWIATFGFGLYKIDKNLNATQVTLDGIPHETPFFTLLPDSNNGLWVGMQNMGLGYLRDGEFKHMDFPSFKNLSVWDIISDEAGGLFIAAGEQGVFHVTQPRTKHHTIKKLSIKNALSLCYHPESKELTKGGEKNLDVLNITSNVSVSTFVPQMGTINSNALVIGENRSVLAGTVNGLYIIHPELSLPSSQKPRIAIDQIRFNYQAIEWDTQKGNVSPENGLPKNPQLHFKQNHITFDLHTPGSTDALIQFKLEGQDTDWSAPTSDFSITYTNLPPNNNYVFKARSISKPSGSVSDETSFSFSISPPFWKTWWFLSLINLAALSLISVYIRFRIHQFKHKNKELELKVNERTQTIENQKVKLEQSLAEKEILIKEIHHRVKNNLQTISNMLLLQSAATTDETARNAVKESQSRVQSIALVHQKLYRTEGVETIEMRAFVAELTLQVSALYNRTDLNITTELEIPESFMLMDKAIPVGLIINELLTNSFKYAFPNQADGKIRICMEFKDAQPVYLSYFDSGVGLPVDKIQDSPTSLGLKIIHILSRQLGWYMAYRFAEGALFEFTPKPNHGH